MLIFWTDAAAHKHSVQIFEIRSFRSQQTGNESHNCLLFSCLALTDDCGAVSSFIHDVQQNDVTPVDPFFLKTSN